MRNFVGYICLFVVFIHHFVSAQLLPQRQQPLYTQAMAVCSHVQRNLNYTANYAIDSLASLPIGIYKQIGQTEYIIAIDSARFSATGATCNAFMALALPGMSDSMAFAAKNIAFNPKGLMPHNFGNSRLMLVSEHILSLGPKTRLYLPNNGSNYIEWNCNGFQAIHLKGFFLFSNTLLQPLNPADSLVIASFEIHSNDIHNLVMAISMSPFRIKGINDMSFAVNEAVADWSSLSNVPGMTVPPGYPMPANSLEWTGFYLKNVTVTLPQELSPKNGSPTNISASNLLIDQNGITGNFTANNILHLHQSDFAKWNFSVSHIGLNLVKNKIQGGSLGGQIQLPIFENNAITYTAGIYQNPQTQQLDYQFSIGAANNISASALGANIDIYPTSQLLVVKTNGKLIPAAILNGRIQFQKEELQTGKLDFQTMKMEPDAPFISQGLFNYTSISENRAANYPVSIHQIQLQILNGKPSVYIHAGMNMMNASDKGFSANVGVFVKTKTNPQNNGRLMFDKIELGAIVLDVNTQPFRLAGTISNMNNHLIYGNAFAGTLTLTLNKPELSVSFNSIFGSKTTYRYFYVDGSLMLPTPVNLTAQVKMKRIMGGLYYRMNRPVDYVNCLQPGFNTQSSFYNYIPDSTKGVGFKAGITVYYATDENALNGDVNFEILFNSSNNGGGIAHMQLYGDAFSMISIQNRLGKRYNQVPVGATANISYNFNQNILHGVLAAAINLNGVTGNIVSAFHFESTSWYVAIGRPSLKGIVNIQNFATVSAYFMTGNTLEPPAQLPFQIAQHFGNPNNRNSSLLSNGQGFCMGANLNGSAHGEYPFSFFTVYGNVNYGLGFDLMMLKVSPDYKCPSTDQSPGFKGYYVTGNLYAYFNAGVGVKGKIEVGNVTEDFDITIFNASAAALLYGELIRPSYIEGNIYASYNILNAINGSITYNFKRGTRCAG